MSGSSPGAWLVNGRPQDGSDGRSPRRRLLCLPYAGGGATIYEPFRRGLPGTAVTAVRLPGRENRFHEPPLHRVEDVVDELVPVVGEQVERDGGLPWAVFGYSLGALIAYELVARLSATGGPVPRLLAVGGAAAPHVPRSDPPVSWLPDDQLAKVLRELGGTNEEVLAEPELMALVLPTVRADFRILESYRWPAGRAALTCAMVTYCADRDAEVRPDDMVQWSTLTSSSSRHRVVAGGHFAPFERPAEILAALGADLDELVG